MDAVDGWMPRDLRTIWCALDGGLRCKPDNDDAIYDALVMLEDAMKLAKKSTN
jgi:hypothetical protein